jgi:putative drug exporter of the RND superfamily
MPFDESFSLPGTESQAALDSLSRTFPRAGGTTAQVVVVAPEGASVRAPEIRAAIEQAVEGYQRIGQIEEAISPFNEYARG